MFSRTTIELSTIMPTPSVMPPSDIMFSVMPHTFMIRKVNKMQHGIAMVSDSVAPRSRRNTSRTTAANSTPIQMFCTALSTVMLM